MRKQLMSAVVIALMMGWGCGEAGEEGDDATPVPAQGSPVALQVDFVGGSDVAGFHYEIRRCGESELVDDATRDLEDLVLPGMIPEFTGSPFDMESRHVFADYYTALEPGCYDVRATPITADGEVSTDCEMAEESGVMVKAEETTEILLISQCEGSPRGALDSAASLNHPPTLDGLDFTKFNRECEEVQICATASDPDGDPFEFQWNQIGGPTLKQGLSVDAGASDCDGVCASGGAAQTQCVNIQLGEAGDYLFRLVVRDLKWLDGALVPFANSQAVLEFPVYAGDGLDGVECKIDGEKK